MISTIQYEKLFEPYTGDGHTFESMLKYLSNEAAQRSIPAEVVELAINEIFASIANGRKFSLVKCSCGCGIDKAATDLIHTVRTRMLNIDKANTEAVKKLMQERYNIFLAGEMQRISKTDKEFVRIMRPTLINRIKQWIISLLQR